MTKRLLVIIALLGLVGQFQASAGCSTQSIPLLPGWNTISSYVLPDDPDMAVVFAGVASDITLVKDGDGKVYLPGVFNQIGDWSAQKGYQVRATNPVSLGISGIRLIPNTTDIGVASGWNIVSYIRNDALDPQSAWASISPGLVLAKNSAGGVFLPGVLNQIGNLQPGQGYQLKMNVADTLVYPGYAPIFVTDASGNTYTAMEIGTQTWMTENLRTTRFCNGDDIPNVSTSISAFYFYGAPAWIHYGFDALLDIPYGKLYNGYVATDVRNACPCGWRVPTDADWNELLNCYGGVLLAGGKLKEAGFDHWASPNTGATNESGFTALPGGNLLRVSVLGSSFYLFTSLNQIGGYWSSALNALYINFDSVETTLDAYPAGRGYSIRCVKE